MKAYISINAGVIRKNINLNRKEPPIRIAKTKSDSKPVYAHEIRIKGPSKLVYSPDSAILRCGARMVLVVNAYEDVKIVK